jgi:hypothetical protein
LAGSHYCTYFFVVLQLFSDKNRNRIDLPRFSVRLQDERTINSTVMDMSANDLIALGTVLRYACFIVQITRMGCPASRRYKSPIIAVRLLR